MDTNLLLVVGTGVFLTLLIGVGYTIIEFKSMK